MITLLSSILVSGSFLSGYDPRFHDLVLTWFTVIIIVAIACFVVSELTRNYSQVDKLWSLMPVAYSWITVAAFPSVRLYIMAALVTLWGLNSAIISTGREDTILFHGRVRKTTGGKFSEKILHLKEESGLACSTCFSFLFTRTC